MSQKENEMKNAPFSESHKNIIIINNSRNAKLKNRNFLTYDNGSYLVHCQLGSSLKKVNGAIIKKTLSYIRKTVSLSQGSLDTSPKSNRKQPKTSHHKIIFSFSGGTNEEPSSDRELISGKEKCLKCKTNENLNFKDTTPVSKSIEIQEKNELDFVKKNATVTKYIQRTPNFIEEEKADKESTDRQKSDRTELGDKSSFGPKIISLIRNQKYTPSPDEVTPRTGFERCLICDKLVFQSKLNKTEKCDHLICNKCFKNYFEEKIEQGYERFKCPVFSCDCYYPRDYLKLIVSQHHFEVIEKKKSGLRLSIAPDTNLKNNLKKYTNQHVIDIGSNELFYKFSRTKSTFCPRCNEQSLFGKSGTHFVKCLNCFYSMCKYCMKEFDNQHLDMGSENYCKVYYRRQGGGGKERSFIGKYISEVLLFICSYLIVIAGCFCNIERCIERLFRRKFYPLSILVSTIVYCFVFPFLIVLFPYFPIFTATLG